MYLTCFNVLIGLISRVIFSALLLTVILSTLYESLRGMFVNITNNFGIGYCSQIVSVRYTKSNANHISKIYQRYETLSEYSEFGS
jgi:hypothetical protein